MTAEVSLSDLRPGEQATICRIETTVHHVRRRLMELGLTKGTRVEIIRMAPLGDPIEVLVMGYRLSLRKLEAASVFVQKGN